MKHGQTGADGQMGLHYRSLYQAILMAEGAKGPTTILPALRAFLTYLKEIFHCSNQLWKSKAKCKEQELGPKLEMKIKRARNM